MTQPSSRDFFLYQIYSQRTSLTVKDPPLLQEISFSYNAPHQLNAPYPNRGLSPRAPPMAGYHPTWAQPLHGPNHQVRDTRSAGAGPFRSHQPERAPRSQPGQQQYDLPPAFSMRDFSEEQRHVLDAAQVLRTSYLPPCPQHRP